MPGPANDSADRPDADEVEERGGIFMGLSAGAGSAGSPMSAGLGAIETFVNPAAARAREALQQQHERVIATPSPGDRLLKDGRVVIDLSPEVDDTDDSDP